MIIQHPLLHTLVRAIIADADSAYGGPTNETVTSDTFIPNMLTRIDNLLGCSVPAPTKAQVESLKQSIALPTWGTDSYVIMRQRAIDTSVSIMWGHLHTIESING